MKASEYKRGWRGETTYDELKDYIESEDGNAKLRQLDCHWREVMELAERYGFIVQSYGGIATLSTHTEYIDQLGAEKAAQRLRMCNVEMGDAKGGAE